MRDAQIVILATFLSYPAGILIGQHWLLPILNTAPAYLIMLRLIVRGERRGAVRIMLLWAAALALFGTVAFAVWPQDPGEVVIHGTQYRDEMFRWIRTGEGSEGSPRLFLPQHLLHLGAFVALSAATASGASVLMGTVLMNSMAYYVGSLARHGLPSGAVILLGWQPWALCRVAAFCTLGVVLAEPLLSRLLRFPYRGLAPARRLLLWASAGILADWILKATLAPLWREWLHGLLP